MDMQSGAVRNLLPNVLHFGHAHWHRGELFSYFYFNDRKTENSYTAGNLFRRCNTHAKLGHHDSNCRVITVRTTLTADQLSPSFFLNE